MRDTGFLKRIADKDHSFWIDETLSGASNIKWPIKLNTNRIQLNWRFSTSPSSYEIIIRQYAINNGVKVVGSETVFTGEASTLPQSLSVVTNGLLIGIEIKDTSGTIADKTLQYFRVSEIVQNLDDEIKKLSRSQHTILFAGVSQTVPSPYASEIINTNRNNLLLAIRPVSNIPSLEVNILHMPVGINATISTQKIFDSTVDPNYSGPIYIPFESWSNSFKVQLIRKDGGDSMDFNHIELSEIKTLPDLVPESRKYTLPIHSTDYHDLNATIDRQIVQFDKFYTVAHVENRSSLHPVKIDYLGQDFDWVIQPGESRSIDLIRPVLSLGYTSEIGTAMIRLTASNKKYLNDRPGKDLDFEFTNYKDIRVLDPRARDDDWVFATDTIGKQLMVLKINTNNPDEYEVINSQLFQKKILDIYITGSEAMLIGVGTIGQSDFQLFRSPPGSYGVEVAEVTLPTGASSWFPNAGITETHGGDLIFAEYANDGTDTSIYRSTDDGVTFTNVLSVPSTEIRHWHTVDADLNHRDDVYATSGDSHDEIRWYKSTDRGATWAEIMEIRAVPGAKYKTLGLIIQDKHIIWATDAPGFRNSVFRAPKDDLVAGRIEVLRSNQVFFGMIDSNDFMFTWAVGQHGGNSVKRESYFGEIYYSKNGIDWKLLSQWKAKGSYPGNCGFRWATRPSKEGVVYLTTDRNLLVGHDGDYNTIRIKPKNF